MAVDHGRQPQDATHRKRCSGSATACFALLYLLACASTFWLLDLLFSAGVAPQPSCPVEAEPQRTVAFWPSGAGPVRWAVRPHGQAWSGMRER